ncbi:MAG TPA: VOC family protein [Ktedonobacteraceae bacterium]|nr:VOC family protein [Ktedonobacteraceae bacterium]
MSAEQQASSTPASIHPGTNIGLVTLRISNLERSRNFYEGILHFQPIEQTPGKLVLGAQDKQPLLELIEIPGATPQPRRATGLYHVAIVFPTRADLGRELLNLINAGLQIGQGDHLVSEALYISDPDHNGLELYRDRPRNTWHWTNNVVEMATDPVDIQGLVEEGIRDAEPWEVIPTGTRVGHIHLQIGDIEEARQFYHTILGFDVTAHLPGALFVSAGGYHHHIGLNTWQSLGAKPTPANSAGLQHYVIAIPTREGLLAVKERLLAHNVPFEEQEDLIRVNDPWNNHILLKVQPGI